MTLMPANAIVYLAMLATLLASSPGFAADPVRISPERMQEGIDGLSRFGRDAHGGVSRVAFSEN